MSGPGYIRLVWSTHQHLFSAPHTEKSPHGRSIRSLHVTQGTQVPCRDSESSASTIRTPARHPPSLFIDSYREWSQRASLRKCQSLNIESYLVWINILDNRTCIVTDNYIVCCVIMMMYQRSNEDSFIFIQTRKCHYWVLLSFISISYISL